MAAKKEKDVIKKLTIEDLKKAYKKPIESLQTISTGSLAVDKGSGVGGLPIGKIVEMFGPESSGKSTVSIMTCAEALSSGKTVGFLDAEYAFDPNYAKTLGMDIEHENCYFYQPDGLEDCLNTAVAWATSGLFDVIVIDSMSATAPIKEQENEIGSQSSLGLKARALSQFCRVITPILSKNNTLLIIIGQLREKIGVMFGNPETTDYGNAMKFYASMRLRVSRSVDKDKKSAETRVKFVKNKCAVPFAETSFQLIHGEGIDKSAEIYDMGISTGVLTKQGNTAFYGEDKLAGSRAKSIDLLRDNPELSAIIKGEIMKSNNLTITEEEYD